MAAHATAPPRSSGSGTRIGPYTARSWCQNDLGSVGAGELGVVPGHDLGHVDADGDALRPHLLQHRERAALERPGVPLVHAAADGEDALAVVEDRPRADQLDPAQLVVRVARLDQAGDAQVAPEVLHLLRLA